jgi:hypothetical protein
MHWSFVGILIWIGIAIAPTVIGGSIRILSFLAPYLIVGAVGGVVGGLIGGPSGIGTGAICGVGLILLAMWIAKLLNTPRKSAAEKEAEAAKLKHQEAAYRELFRPRG